MSDRQRKMTPEIQQEFSRLMRVDPDNALKPKAVVRAAESPTNPLHRYFVWDDQKAADQYRLEQARDLIQSFVVHSEEANTEVRVLTSLDIDRAGGVGYRWTTEVLERPNLREQFLQTAIDELTRVEDRYRHVKELVSVWAAIDTERAKVAAKTAKTEKKTQRKVKAKATAKKVVAPKTPKSRSRPSLNKVNGFVAHPAT